MRNFLFIMLLLPFAGISQIYESNYQLNWSRDYIPGTRVDLPTKLQDSLVIFIDYKTATLVKHEFRNQQFTTDEFELEHEHFYGDIVSIRGINKQDSTYYLKFNGGRDTIYYHQQNQDTIVHVRELSGRGIKIVETNIIYKGFWEEKSENQEAYLLDLTLLNGDWRMDVEDTIVWTYQIDSIYSNDINYYKSAAKGRKFYNKSTKGFGQYFYITLESESQVRITDRSGCFAYEYWIRKLTEDELILFNGFDVIRFIKE